MLRRFTTGRLTDETHWLPNKEMTKLSEVSDETCNYSLSGRAVPPSRTAIFRPFTVGGRKGKGCTGLGL